MYLKHSLSARLDKGRHVQERHLTQTVFKVCGTSISYTSSVITHSNILTADICWETVEYSRSPVIIAFLIN